MHRLNRFAICAFALIGVTSFASVTMAAKPEDKQKHGNMAAKEEGKHQNQEAKQQGHGHRNNHNGKNLVGAKIKTNGHHVLEQKGDVTASVEVKDGKIAGLHAKHAKKGDLPVKKYKSNKQMAQVSPMLPGGEARLIAVQDQYVGTMWIGYSYYNDYGEEDIYWFPVDMILDGETGAIWYEDAA